MLALERFPKPLTNYSIYCVCDFLSMDIALSKCICRWIYIAVLYVCVCVYIHLIHADLYVCLALCDILSALETISYTKILQLTPQEGIPIPFSLEIHEEFGLQLNGLDSK